MRPFPLLLIAMAAGAACHATAPSAEVTRKMDIHSFSEPARVRVRHVALDLDLDFASRRVTGEAELTIERPDPEADLVLDTMGLTISAVTGSDGSPRRFELEPEVPRFGRPLRIGLEPGDRTVKIAYRTGEGAEALQWLAPEQTAGGEYPFLFTQGQAVLTRSWIPLQDSPGARVTYDARVRAPEGLTVVMSAESRGAEQGTWSFALEHPVPPYLIALACGDLESRAISGRCAVWAEPSLVEAARWEFADTEEMIRRAEKLFGPYRWGRYDLLILPPSFPYGGMENPLLTFLTPTVIAGDRSLVSIIAHELAHSWSGNLVTNATWSDFWLNEGFTVYCEKRIMEEVYGVERARMEMLLDFDGLRREMAGLKPWQTVLDIDLEGKHPDDGFSGVPYEKGALFLRRLEQAYGREALDALLTAWFDEHAFESVTTAQFEAFLQERLLAGDPRGVDVHAWLHEPGLPDDAPRAASDGIAQVDREVERLASGVEPSALATDGWVTQQWLHFLESMPESTTPADMAALDAAFTLTGSGNSEILFTWLKLAIRTGYAVADERLEQFLMTVGRRKYLQPLYEELVKTEAGRERAREIYARARPRYHAVSSLTLDRIVAAGE